MELSPQLRQEWIERIGWIRLVDRLAENDSLDRGSRKFQTFANGWKTLQHAGTVDDGHPYETTLRAMQRRWFRPGAGALEERSIAAWDDYLAAIARYHMQDLTLDTLEDYEQMLDRLAGRFFQILPFLPLDCWDSARAFGKVDQFYNNLRDLREDAEQGVCYFPREILERFGVEREEILQLRCFGNPGYREMMEFWLEEFLPTLLADIDPFVRAPDLHESWQTLRYWSLHRYSRIEQIFHWCAFDFGRFSREYWPAVRRDLRQWQRSRCERQ